VNVSLKAKDKSSLDQITFFLLNVGTIFLFLEIVIEVIE